MKTYATPPVSRGDLNQVTGDSDAVNLRLNHEVLSSLPGILLAPAAKGPTIRNVGDLGFWDVEYLESGNHHEYMTGYLGTDSDGKIITSAGGMDADS